MTGRLTVNWRLGLAAVTVLALLIWLVLIGPGARAGTSVSPECVKVNLVENSGNGPTLYGVLFCGTGSGGDSPVHDSEAGDTWIVDGGPFASHAVVLDGD